jgi:hypothetical protein
MTETEKVLPQKVHIGLALVIYTDRPDLWQDKEQLKYCLATCQEDLVMFQSHNYGRPSTDDEFKIEFDAKREEEKCDTSLEESGCGCS